MRRSELKRGTSQLKRSRIKRKPYKPIDTVEIYRVEHDRCEFGLYGVRQCKRPRAHVHHMLGRKFKLCHDPRNLLAACEECHAWVEANVKDGVVLSLTAKRLSGELDIEWLEKAIDRPVLGRVRVWVECGDVSCVAMAEELLKAGAGT